MNQINTSHLKEKFISSFDIFNSKLNGRATSSINKIRSAAIKRFEILGFPTTKNEEWKYTNINPILNNEFDFLTTRISPAPTESESTSKSNIQPCLFHRSVLETPKLVETPNLDVSTNLGVSNTVVFINGHYSKEFSTIISPANELRIESLAKTMANDPGMIDKHFGKYADFQNNAFTALSTAFAADGAFIYVPEEAVVSYPVLLYFITDTRQSNIIAQPRNLFLLGKNSRVSIAESFSTIDLPASHLPRIGQAGVRSGFTNIVTEIMVGKNAAMDYYKIQNDRDTSWHIGTTQVYQAANSNFTSTTVSLNGDIIRNDLNIKIDGEGCETQLYGLYLLNGKSHVDNHTLVDHAVPNSLSKELYKGILDDKSTGVFNGKVIVRQDAQKTNAFQSNKNILLSNDATVNTKPQLEIFADDVKCSHGATTGQIDEEALFYLRSRGIDEGRAKALLIHAFVSEILDKIKIGDLKEYLQRVIADRLNK